MPAAFPCRCFVFFSPQHTGILTAALISPSKSTLLSQRPCSQGHTPSRGCTQGSGPATHCPASLFFLSNLGGSFHDPAALLFCIPIKLASCGWCQGLLPAWVAARSSWTGSSLWVHGAASVRRATWGALSQGKDFSVVCSFIPVGWWDLASSRDALKVASFVPLKSQGFLVSSLSLFSGCVSLSTVSSMLIFWPKYMVFRPFCCVLASDSHCKPGYKQPTVAMLQPWDFSLQMSLPSFNPDSCRNSISAISRLHCLYSDLIPRTTQLLKFSICCVLSHDKIKKKKYHVPDNCCFILFDPCTQSYKDYLHCAPKLH